MRSGFLNKVKSLLTRGSTVKVEKAILDDIVLLTRGQAEVAFDVGAHHGRYAAELAKRIAVKKIFCFEPFPQSFNELKKNLKDSIYHHQQLAVSNYSGVATFYVNYFDETNSLLPSAATGSGIDRLTEQQGLIEVTVETLENFCEKNSIRKIDLLKIDAQGNSYNVLKGAVELLRNKAFKLIQCEAEFLEIYKGEHLYHKIAILLEEYGYSLYSLYNIHYDVNGRISWADALFFPDAK
jgi:FkbM family methyltransferase